ncbi:MAG: hypothetical protein JXR11_02510 [Balneola sp.]
MKYSVADSAKIVGKTRQTIYRHIESKPISVEKDDNDEMFIDASELIRVYGNDINFGAVNEEPEQKRSPQKAQGAVPANASSEAPVLQEKINALEKQLAMKDDQIDRERDLREEQIATLKDALEKAQIGHNSVTRLLEDHTGRPDGVGGLEKAMRGLEARVANQERESKETERKAKRVFKAYKKTKQELEAERNKPFWKKLLGKA